MARQNELRQRFVVVELRDETFEHRARVQAPIRLRIIRAIAPVLPGAEEEHLDARLSALLVRGKHVRLFDTVRIDHLIGGDVRQRPQPVAKLGGLLIILLACSRFHHLLIHPPHVLALPAQKCRRVIDELGVVLGRNLARARRCTPFDLIQQARPRPPFVNAVRARPQQERPLQHVDRADDRPRGCERPEIVALRATRAAMLEDLRRRHIAAHQDIGKRLVIPHQHVVARTQPLDQIGLEQQRFGFGADRHELHRRRGHHHPQDAVGEAGRARIV